MKATFLICCILAVALLGFLSCIPEATLEISVSDETVSVAATLIENGVMIQNVGDVDCLVFVSSPEGEQQLELDVGESITVTDVTNPTEIAAVRL